MMPYHGETSLKLLCSLALCSLPETKLSVYRQCVKDLAARIPPVQPPVYCQKPVAKAAIPSALSAHVLTNASR